MRKKLVFAILIPALVSLTTLSPAKAGPRSPADIAQACIDNLAVKAERGCDGINKQVNRALPRIRLFIADGKKDRAVALARRTISSVRRLSQRCNSGIGRLANRAMDRLRGIDEEDLACCVQNARTCAVDTVNARREEALAAIADALGDGSE
jgi:hypothetical protein